ncbi:MAG: hypothetical protein F6K24_41600 [Okeania sp. SIO2D1]|nr:hypothetical protein [Okeania sp. SIO2D1]
MAEQRPKKSQLTLQLKQLSIDSGWDLRSLKEVYLSTIEDFDADAELPDVDILPTLLYETARDSLTSLLGAFCFIAPAFGDLLPEGLTVAPQTDTASPAAFLVGVPSLGQHSLAPDGDAGSDRLGEKKPANSELQKQFITQAKKVEDREWLSEVSVVPLQQSLNDLNQAYQNFFSSTKGQRKSQAIKPPKFKTRKSRADCQVYLERV